MKLKLQDISTIAEVGCGDWRSCTIKDYGVDYKKLYLFEPNLLFYQDIIKNTINNDKIKSFNCAVSNKDYIGEFYTYGYTSFLKGSDSFVNLWSWKALGQNPPNDPEVFYKDLITNVNIIDGARLPEVDFLILTCNGCEFNVLERLQFRPKLIRVKYYLHTIEQINYFSKVTNWMINNGYQGKIIDRSQYDQFQDIIFVKT